MIKCHKPENVLVEARRIEAIFPVPEKDILFIHPFVYEKNSISYLPFLSIKSLSIQLLNLETGKIAQIISLLSLDTIGNFAETETETVNNVKWGCKFFFHNKDSIFIEMDATQNTIFLIDSNGQIKNKWLINLQTEFPFGLEFFNQFQTTYYKGKIIVRMVPLINADHEGTERIKGREYRQKFFSYKPDLIIDIKQFPSKYRFFGTWPKKYIETDYRDTYPYRCIGYNEQVVYSFKADHDLYVFSDINDSVSVKINGKSRYIDFFQPFSDDSTGNVPYINKHYITAPYYSQLVYDKYRNYYYRIAWHSIPFLKDNETLNTFRDKPWSLLMFDSSLTLQKEILFDQGKYSPYSFQVIKDGILIHRYNEEKTEKKENFHFSWILFKVKL